MRTIIAGCRHWKSPQYAWLLESALRQCAWTSKITSVICGEATGIDTFGRIWAGYHRIPVVSCPARWDLHGKSAGYIRNGEMAQIADALIAVWDKQSKGTKSMISIAKMHRLQSFVYVPSDQELSLLASSESFAPSRDVWQA